MIRITLAPVGVSLFGLLALELSSGMAHAADLDLTVTGIEDRGGKLYVSVQTEGEFMGPSGTAGQIIDEPGAGSVALTFDVPPGRYAVSVWHDFNANGTFDMRDNGMPLDGWAMSGPMGDGPPSFEDVAVTVDAQGGAVDMTMVYPD